MDEYPQLQTRHGSIDTVYISPYGAIALQWYTKIKYATNIPVTNGIGALVVSNRFFRKLPKDLQILLKRTGDKAGKLLVQTARKDNTKSIEILKESGIEFMWNWDEIDQKELFDLRDKAAAHLEKTKYIPKHYFERTRKLLDTYRLKKQLTEKSESQEPVRE
jgi:TRAP-type C4-dicarboxylate transport system substrate-binding protein